MSKEDNVTDGGTRNEFYTAFGGALSDLRQFIEDNVPASPRRAKAMALFRDAALLTNEAVALYGITPFQEDDDDASEDKDGKQD